MLAALTAFAWSSLLHPLGGDGYQVWSGIGSDVSEVAILAALFSWLRGRNCHVHRCWRLSWHAHPESDHPVCRHHHPHHECIGEDGAVDADLVAAKAARR